MDTVAFTRLVAERLNDFVAEGFHFPALATDFPQNAMVADFLHIEFDEPVSRTELAIVHAVIADFISRFDHD